MKLIIALLLLAIFHSTQPWLVFSRAHFFILNGPIPASFCLFSVFSNKQYNFTTNPCEKMPCPSRKRHRDSNPRPLKHESSPITTRLGLPPQSILGCRTSLTVLQRRQTSLIIARNMCSSFSGKVQLNNRMSCKKILF